MVALHPSCGLTAAPDWVIFNEFVLTTQPYIRTVTVIEPEWLLEYAGPYFDLNTFPEGRSKDALRAAQERFIAKQQQDKNKAQKKKKKQNSKQEAE